MCKEEEAMSCERKDREGLSQDVTEALIEACITFDEKFVVLTLLDTGLRTNELASLKKENI
jgi:integrase/recombinase XerD